MQASELAEQVVSAANIATCDGYYEIDTDKVTAMIEQSKAHWIAEGRAQGSRLAASSLDKAHEAGVAEGMERAAVIVDGFAFCGHIATAIRAAKGS